jgi:hypothetical protein
MTTHGDPLGDETNIAPEDDGGFSQATGSPTSSQGVDKTPAESMDDETGEFGAAVDRDTGAGVGDTGTPALDENPGS